MAPKTTVRKYIMELAAGGRYHFTSREVRSAVGVTRSSVNLVLNSLKRQTLIASPARGFHVSVPAHYRALGCVPADQFISALMKHLNLPYYVGLLSAAEYHGATHQRPREFQVLVAKKRRPIQCGRVRVAFIARKGLADVPTKSFNCARGKVRVSSPEATALDLIGYADHAGGLRHVARILCELVQRIDPEKLATAARSAPLPWAQRLGYLLEHLGFPAKAIALKEYVHQEYACKRAKVWTVLLAKTPLHQWSHRNQDWKVHVNAKWTQGSDLT